MVHVANLIYILAWMPLILYKAVIWLYYIQEKEYRFDRFYVLLFSKDAFRKLLIGNSALMFGVGFLIAEGGLSEFLLLATIFLLDIKVVLTLMRQGLRRPLFTNRLMRIAAITLIPTLVPVLFFYFGYLTAVAAFILSEIVFITFLAIGVYFTGLIAQKIKTNETVLARKILKTVHPYVVGVTGSYGKTTTKDFIYHILSSHYKVLKTQDNENTSFGVIRRISSFLTKSIKYFIVEMGAYKRGEIKEMCELVQPLASIITGIEEQHLALFGSFDNILKAKFEIIEALPKKGIAIFNYSNRFCVALAKRAKKLPTSLRVYGYRPLSKKSEKLGTNEMAFKIVSETPQGISFKIYFQGKTLLFNTPIVGNHFIENLTGAVLVSYLLGVPWIKIKTACKTLSLPKGTMQVITLQKGVVVVNDTYNSTPKSFVSAIGFSKKFKGTKVLVTPGIIELGDKSSLVHKEIGKRLRGVFTRVVVTNMDPLSGLREGFMNSVEFVPDPTRQLCLVKEMIQKGDCLILFEGRQSKIVMDYLTKLT